jgi:hypothetical protein
VVDIAESRKADQRFQIWGGGVMIAFYGWDEALSPTRASFAQPQSKCLLLLKNKKCFYFMW